MKIHLEIRKNGSYGELEPSMFKNLKEQNIKSTSKNLHPDKIHCIVLLPVLDHLCWCPLFGTPPLVRPARNQIKIIKPQLVYLNQVLHCIISELVEKLKDYENSVAQVSKEFMKPICKQRVRD